MSIIIPDDAPRRVLELDEYVRFVGFADRFGKKIVSEYRKGLDPLLTDDELKLQATNLAQIMNTIKNLTHELGNPIYLSTLY